MKKLVILFVVLTMNTLLWGQQFNNCVAACINKNAIVTSYDINAACEIWKDAAGKLEIYTVDISEKGISPRKKIKFKVAIKDANTQTIWLYSEATFTEVLVEKILEVCKKGDSILLLTKDKSYALPHNEIHVL